jgi:hypothetical protein
MRRDGAVRKFFILGIGRVFATVGRGEIEIGLEGFLWPCGGLVGKNGYGSHGTMGVVKDERRNHGIDDGGMNETVGVWLERVNF